MSIPSLNFASHSAPTTPEAPSPTLESRVMTPRNRNILIVVGALVVLIGFAIIANKRGGSSATPVKVYKVTSTEFTVKLPENGVIQRPSMVTIPSLVSGNIGRILVKAGDAV